MKSLQSVKNSSKWQFWVDRGGTFTDIIGRAPSGELVTKKLLSYNPDQYQDATLEGIRQILNLRSGELIPKELVQCLKMGTTVATNALLERNGERTALVTTLGFKDALRIAYQNRPKIFDRHIQLPELLYSQVVEVEERIAANGKVMLALEEKKLLKSLKELLAQGIKSIAIVFMHAYAHPSHEKRVGEIAKSLGFSQISMSHQVAPLIKLVSRGDTTVVDAYLTPILKKYIEHLKEQMPGIEVFFMQSSGGLAKDFAFQGKDAILSGPAGGIVGMSRTAQLAGEKLVIGFDMGGTSTDVSHFAGEFEREYETQVAGVRVRAPMMNIHTVASGGGSLLFYEGNKFRVGPQSAGSHPGPVSYGKGGPLALTDANVMLGKIRSEYFPRVFGLSGQEGLDVEAVKSEFNALSKICGLSPEITAQSFIKISVEQMANAIKKISVARGYDVTLYTLQCFGGAGAQHACLVADALGMKKIMIHAMASVMSAYGMGLADQSLIKEKSVGLLLSNRNFEAINEIVKVIGTQVTKEIQDHLGHDSSVKLKSRLKVKYEGSDSALELDFADIEEIKTNFDLMHLKRYSFFMSNKSMIIDAVIVEGIVLGEKIQNLNHKQYQTIDNKENLTNLEPKTVAVFMEDKWQSAKLLNRDSLRNGDEIFGPLLITEDYSTIVVEPGWKLCVHELGHLILEKENFKSSEVMHEDAVNPMRLEIFNNLFMNIAEQMGLRLQNTAHSVNIKERLDFSCAIFDASGKLIANAPHMPVHLGSMSESVKSVIDNNQGSIYDGDVFVLNDPYNGGTHLPDITVITPCFIKEFSDRDPFLFVGSRGHHADVGGITPGSMPAFSTQIEEEGVLISNFKLVNQFVYQESGMLDLLNDAPYPCRNAQQNLADLNAQIAANEKGILELKACIKQYGFQVVKAYMQHVQDHASQAVRKLLKTLKGGTFRLPLDNGAIICVNIHVDAVQGKAIFDFEGTSHQQENNFNSPKAVSVAAILYVLRSLIDDDIPLNAGCLEPIEIRVPKGSMLNPNEGAAVVAGNVETSMCITNAIFGALGVMASSQPTMNNLTFGNDRYQYYETIAGGSGAGCFWDDQGKIIGGFNGTSVVQTHMTNSRLTDPEVLEERFPVILEKFCIRECSGGLGRFQGGDGAIRVIKFLEKMTVSILSNGRIQPAFGMNGGQNGLSGENLIHRHSGFAQKLNPSDQTQVQAGDRIEILTPGGGGFGMV